MKKIIKILSILFFSLYPIFGVIKFGWLISDVFFWWYFEYLLAFLSVYLVLSLRWKYNEALDSQSKRGEKIEFLFSFFYISFFASLLCFLPIKQQWDQIGGLQNLIENKLLFLGLAIIAMILSLWKDYQDKEIISLRNINWIERPLVFKAGPMVLLYGGLILQRIVTGSEKLFVDGNYVFMMILVLLASRAGIELLIMHYDDKKEKGDIIIMNNRLKKLLGY